jgi:hypothetical protein
VDGAVELVEGVENAPIRVREEVSQRSSVTRIEEWPICAWRYFGCAPAATISAA